MDDFFAIAGISIVGTAALIGALFLLAAKNSMASKTFALDAAIQTVVDAIRGLPYEVMYVLDQQGNTICFNTQYDQILVNLTDEQITYLKQHPGSIGIHNHDTDTPPSHTDLIFAACTLQQYLIVITPKYQYTVAPPESGWKSQSEVENACRKYIHLFRIVSEHNRVIDVDPNNGSFVILYETELESTDASIEALTRELGYTYQKKELE